MPVVSQRKKSRQRTTEPEHRSAARVEAGRVVHGAGKKKRKAAGEKTGKKKSGKKKAASERATAGKKKPSAGRKGKAAARARRPRYTAATADRYELYQLAVQAPEADIAFLNRVFRKHAGRKPLHLCEDFCGTALFSSNWVAQGPEHTAEGFDIDPDPVRWGREHNIAPLGDAGGRVTLHLKDVRNRPGRPVDLRIGFNFSWSCLRTRAELLDYFRHARESLVDDGLFVLDMHGGPEAIEEMEEVRNIEGGFKYVWEQRSYFPGTGEYRCSIGFRFRDGSRIRRAFEYTWRFWYLTEVKDVLADAGFREVELYFEAADEDGDGNGVFRRSDRGANDASWIAYVVAKK